MSQNYSRFAPPNDAELTQIYAELVRGEPHMSLGELLMELSELIDAGVEPDTPVVMRIKNAEVQQRQVVHARYSNNLDVVLLTSEAKQ